MGKSYLITGASSGIGAATALQLTGSKEASKLTLVARNKENLEEVARKCREIDAAVEVFVLPKDLSVVKQCEEAVEEAAQKMGRLDVLISNHGGSKSAQVRELSTESFEHCLKLNLTSHFVLTKHAIPHLEKTKGNVVYVSSIAAQRPSERVSHYCAAKAGLDQFCRTVAMEEVGRGIRFNVVSPGIIITPIHTALLPSGETDLNKIREMLNPAQPLGRAGEAEEIAKLIEFIASDKNAFMTGSVVTSDGGFSQMTFGPKGPYAGQE